MEGWLARDENDSLWFYTEKPYKNTCEGKMRWEGLAGFLERVEEYKETDETRKISWEDPEPTHVRMKYEII